MGDKLRTSSEIRRTSQHYYNEGFSGARNWAPIVSRNASISNSYMLDPYCFLILGVAFRGRAIGYGEAGGGVIPSTKDCL